MSKNKYAEAPRIALLAICFPGARLPGLPGQPAYIYYRLSLLSRCLSPWAVGRVADERTNGRACWASFVLPGNGIVERSFLNSSCNERSSLANCEIILNFIVRCYSFFLSFIFHNYMQSITFHSFIHSWFFNIIILKFKLENIYIITIISHIIITII